jgi:hypothetical protein
MQKRDASYVKLQVFIPGDLRREIGEAAEAAGQALTVWVARTLAAAVLSMKAKGTTPRSAPSGQADATTLT